MINFKKDESLVYKFAPDCWELFLTLMPFMDVVHSYSAGPQPQCKHYDPSEPQHIELDFSEWKDGEIIIVRYWRIEKDRVVLHTDDGEFPSSMLQLWNYLRQLPRDVYVFANSAD